MKEAKNKIMKKPMITILSIKAKPNLLRKYAKVPLWFYEENDSTFYVMNGLKRFEAVQTTSNYF